LIKNSHPFGKDVRKPQGGFFLTHTVVSGLTFKVTGSSLISTVIMGDVKKIIGVQNYSCAVEYHFTLPVGVAKTTQYGWMLSLVFCRLVTLRSCL